MPRLQRKPTPLMHIFGPVALVVFLVEPCTALTVVSTMVPKRISRSCS